MIFLEIVVRVLGYNVRVDCAGEFFRLGRFTPVSVDLVDELCDCVWVSTGVVSRLDFKFWRFLC